MSFTDMNQQKRTDPILIPIRGRPRSASTSSSSSCSSPDNLSTPHSSIGRTSVPSHSTSPILSFFMTQPPTKSPSAANTFPFRKFGAPPVFEEEEDEHPAALHARRASATIATRFTQPPSFVATEAHVERGTNLFRRLSLGAPAFNKPQADQNTRPVSPTTSSKAPVNKPRRSATISTSRPVRAPSPMGERILKGHFDGFN